MQRSFRLILDRIRSNITWRRLAVVVLVLLVAAATRVAYLLWPEWTGFGEKTLWDLLELLIIPAVLGFGALWFNQAARTREQKIARDQQREGALQNYLDKMAQLLLEKELLARKDNSGDPVVDVAHVRTVTTVRILDANRRNILFQFLRDANLADFVLVKSALARADLSETSIYSINLSGANMTEAGLSRADLSGANLTKANLTGANLTGANLIGANLTGANLKEASLTKANLIAASLTKADLTGANLAGAGLNRADLTGANLVGAILAGAYLIRAGLNRADLTGANLSVADLTGANLTEARYDSQTKWPEGFDYKNSGAILSDQ
jgi:uncharacterized protein YjbI with pentapeptide repeats